jgi:hypothetical protein
MAVLHVKRWAEEVDVLGAPLYLMAFKHIHIIGQ